jgi:hypothetical protein
LLYVPPKTLRPAKEPPPPNQLHNHKPDSEIRIQRQKESARKLRHREREREIIYNKLKIEQRFRRRKILSSLSQTASLSRTLLCFTEFCFPNGLLVFSSRYG